MTSVSQLDGVTQLQAAKAAATTKIEEARTRRIKKLKQAKSEALIEADYYKAKREAEIRELGEKYSKQHVEVGSKIDLFTEQAVQKLRLRYEENREYALKEIIAHVLDVNQAIHHKANSA